MFRTITIMKIIDCAEVLHKLRFRATFRMVVPTHNQEGDEIGKICIHGKNNKDKVIISVSTNDVMLESNSELAKNYLEYLAEELVFNGETCILK